MIELIRKLAYKRPLLGPANRRNIAVHQARGRTQLASTSELSICDSGHQPPVPGPHGGLRSPARGGRIIESKMPSLQADLCVSTVASMYAEPAFCACLSRRQPARQPPCTPPGVEVSRLRREDIRGQDALAPINALAGAFTIPIVNPLTNSSAHHPELIPSPRRGGGDRKQGGECGGLEGRVCGRTCIAGLRTAAPAGGALAAPTPPQGGSDSRAATRGLGHKLMS